MERSWSLSPRQGTRNHTVYSWAVMYSNMWRTWLKTSSMNSRSVRRTASLTCRHVLANLPIISFGLIGLLSNSFTKVSNGLSGSLQQTCWLVLNKWEYLRSGSTYLNFLKASPSPSLWMTFSQFPEHFSCSCLRRLIECWGRTKNLAWNSGRGHDWRLPPFI